MQVLVSGLSEQLVGAATGLRVLRLPWSRAAGGDSVCLIEFLETQLPNCLVVEGDDEPLAMDA